MCYTPSVSWLPTPQRLRQTLVGLQPTLPSRVILKLPSSINAYVAHTLPINLAHKAKYDSRLQVPCRTLAVMWENTHGLWVCAFPVELDMGCCEHVMETHPHSLCSLHPAASESIARPTFWLAAPHTLTGQGRQHARSSLSALIPDLTPSASVVLAMHHTPCCTSTPKT